MSHLELHKPGKSSSFLAEDKLIAILYLYSNNNNKKMGCCWFGAHDYTNVRVCESDFEPVIMNFQNTKKKTANMKNAKALN